MMGLMASDETRTETRTKTRTETRTETQTGTGAQGRAGGVVSEVPGEASATRAWTTWTTRLLILGIVLAAVNLRPAITSLGALLEEVRDGLGMSGSIAGLLTSVPRSASPSSESPLPGWPAASDPARWSAPAWSPSPRAC